MALAAAGLPAMLFGWGMVAWVVVAARPLPGRTAGMVGRVENRRARRDRLMTGLIWSGFGVAVLPLLWLIFVVVSEGLQAVSPEFLTYSMRGVTGDEQGGVYHALVGTLLITLAATRSRSRSACSPRSTWSSTAASRGSRAGSPSWST